MAVPENTDMGRLSAGLAGNREGCSVPDSRGLHHDYKLAAEVLAGTDSMAADERGRTAQPDRILSGHAFFCSHWLHCWFAMPG